MHTHGIGTVQVPIKVPAIRVADAGLVLIQPRIAPP